MLFWSHGQKRLRHPRAAGDAEVVELHVAGVLAHRVAGPATRSCTTSVEDLATLGGVQRTPPAYGPCSGKNGWPDSTRSESLPCSKKAKNALLYSISAKIKTLALEKAKTRPADLEQAATHSWCLSGQPFLTWSWPYAGGVAALRRGWPGLSTSRCQDALVAGGTVRSQHAPAT